MCAISFPNYNIVKRQSQQKLYIGKHNVTMSHDLM